VIILEASISAAAREEITAAAWNMPEDLLFLLSEK
jgi:hypothetical protein